MRHVLILVTVLLLIGCANPVNRHTAIRYAEQAESEMKSGNWFNARMGYGRAITNAQIGGFDEKNLARLWYQYGRASGVICDWDEAERGLNKAYELDKKTGGPAFVSLYELGQMNLDRKKFDKAVEYFERTYHETIAAQAHEKCPTCYAVYLKEYAGALEQVKQTEKAREYRSRADDILKKNPGVETDVSKTPYGRQCRTSP